jgi:hypothetical protein
VTWTGDGTANGLEVWVDGTRYLQATSARVLTPDPMTAAGQAGMSTLSLGTSVVLFSTQTSWDEFLIYDEVITGSAYNSDVAYVAVDEFDGTVATSGGGTLRLGGAGFR